MKTFLLKLSALACFFILSGTAHAQSIEAGKLRIGFRSGLSAANLLFVEAPNKFAGDCPDGEQNCFIDNPEYYTFDYKGELKNTRFGLVGGLFIESTLNQSLTLELGLNYEQKGINLAYTSYTETISRGNRTEEWRYYKRDIRNDYLVVPLVAKYKFNAASGYYVTAGIYTGVLINSDGKAEDSVRTVSTNNDYQSSRMSRFDQEASKELTSALDAGMVVGGGSSWPLGDHFALNADARFNIGVLKIDRNYNNTYEETPVFSPSGPYYRVVSESYYRGLSSQARNISFNLTVGISKSF